MISVSFHLQLLLLLLLLTISDNIVRALAGSSIPTTNNDGMTSSFYASSQQETLTQTFHNLAAATVELSNAHLITLPTTSNDGGLEVLTVERSVRDWDRNGRRKYLYSIPIASTQFTPRISLPLTPTPLDPNLVARCVSPSGQRSILIYKDGEQQFLEIYEGPHLIRRIDNNNVMAKEHGAILLGDATFGSPTFGGIHEEYFIYTAERKPLSTIPYWKKTDSTEKDNSSYQSLRGTEHVLGKGISEQWGERYESLQVPLTDVYVLHVPTGEFIGRVPVFDDVHYHSDYDHYSTLDSICLCQPILHPNDPNKLSLTVYDAGGLGQMSRRLGMIFCKNRPSQIVTVDLSKWWKRQNNQEREEEGEETATSTTTTTTVTGNDFQVARSPRYIPLLDGSSTSLVFLGHKKPGFHSHDGCMGLYALEEGSTTIREIIPVIKTPATKYDEDSVLDMGFPGIFTGDLPSDCHIPGTNCILVNTVWGSVSRILSVDISSGKWQVIPVDDDNGNSASKFCSYSLLCVGKDKIIVTKTSSNIPEQLWTVPYTVILGQLKITGEATKMVDLGSMACTSFSAVPKTYEPPFDVEILSVIPHDTTEPIQALLLLPRNTVVGKIPLVVVPHGGPHACSTSTYVPGFSLLASKYAVVLPNYRGSTGFGQAPLTSLLGNIGRLDVDDVMECTRAVLARYSDSRIDSQRIGMCGGSHGGFLTAQCTSQYPDFFKAAVMRNPVTNIASMVTSTDIPDWCHAECLGKTLDFGASYRGPTGEELTVMYEKSPISMIDKVQTPTLIALGLKDLRVPPSQGKEWYFTLRSRGVPSELLVYPEDNHSLSGAATEANHWIRIMEWFDRHL
jgi:acylaminoacyl-peptidase